MLLERGSADLDYWSGVLRALNECYLRMEALPFPVISKVNGLARAGGYEFTLASDFVLIADEARIGDVHAPFGVPPGGGASFRLVRRCGEQRAKELIFTGRWLKGPQAESYGLALRSVPANQLDEVTEELLAMLRTIPGQHRGGQGDAGANRFLSGRAAVDSELGRFVTWARADPLASEGMRAFVDKRDPVWVSEVAAPLPR